MTRYLFQILLLWSPFLAKGQGFLQVWPGDVTNNGFVDNHDFLHLGYAYNVFGPSRDSVNMFPGSFGFQPLPAESWQRAFPGGTNFAHADCDGDGIVNFFNDYFVIGGNYGMQQPGAILDTIAAGIPDEDPKLWLDGSGITTPVNGGQLVEIPIMLGEANLPALNVQGIAFSMEFDPQYIDFQSFEFEFTDDNWLQGSQSMIYMVIQNPQNPKKFDIALTRTDHNHLNGFGSIGKVKFIIIDNIVGLQGNFDVKIDRLQYMDKFGNLNAVVAETLTIPAETDSSSAINEPSEIPNFVVQPNPAHDFLFVSASEIFEGLVIYDVTGSVLSQILPNKTQVILTLADFPKGVYFLKARTENGLSVRKIIKQ